MKFLKQLCAWEKSQFEKPGVRLVFWVIFGIIIGIGMDNIGVGIAIGLPIGIAMEAERNKSSKK